MLGLTLIVLGKMYRRTENRTPILHLAKAGVTKLVEKGQNFPIR